jgi:hypothetical protein
VVPAAEVPLAVSPGHASKLVLVEARCPTFSWGDVEAARGYELVIYRLGKEGAEATPVLRESFAGSVNGWTPSLDRCLERGGQYAWTVRAMGAKRASEWSTPSLFAVAAGPGEAELEAALEVFRQYLAARPSEEDLMQAVDAESADVPPKPDVEETEPLGGTSAEPVPACPGCPVLVVDGLVTAEIGTGAVGASELGAIASVTVECNGGCADITLGEACDHAANNQGGSWRPLFVDCNDVDDFTLGPCPDGSGNNDCVLWLVDPTLGLNRLCDDKSGGDAHVYCIQY